MTSKSDIVNELQRAANTIFDVDPAERQRLLRSGMDEAMSLGQFLRLGGIPDRERPTFMSAMPKLADMAGSADAVEVIVAAGMSMLSGEIERLRGLAEGSVEGRAPQSPTLADALRDAGFEAYARDRLVVGQGRKREPLERRTTPTD